MSSLISFNEGSLQYLKELMIYQNSPTVREEILKSYIEQIFNRYDTQKQGILGPEDITKFFNDLFKSLSISMVLTPQQAYQAVKMVYPNFTSTITRQELFMVFRAMLGVPINPQYATFNPNIMNNTNYINPQMYYNPNLQGQNFVIAQNMMRQNQAQNLQNNFQQMNMGKYMQQNQGNEQFNGGKK